MLDTQAEEMRSARLPLVAASPSPSSINGFTSPMRRRLILFDIDGTILNAKGLGVRSLLGAMQEVFGRTFSVRGVLFAGQTDPTIVSSILEKNNVPLDDPRIK